MRENLLVYLTQCTYKHRIEMNEGRSKMHFLSKRLMTDDDAEEKINDENNKEEEGKEEEVVESCL